MSQNPFPGPQPFRSTDRAHFHGRADLSHRLEGAILVPRAVVVHGPSGSGKSSLIQASMRPEAGSEGTTESTSARVVSVSTPKEIGSDMVRVKVVVLATDADVEVDDLVMARRQGVVEFIGKVGQTRKIYVQRGAKHRSFDVKIGESGATPARIDLNDKPVGPVRPGN